MPSGISATDTVVCREQI